MLKYYKNVVKYNENIPYGIGIITGWKGTEMLLQSLDEESLKKVVTCGNLYTNNGINYIIANLFFNPHINELILVEDSSLNNEMAEGVKAFLEFIKTEIPTFEQKFLFEDKQLKEFINYFKNHIQIVKRKDLNEVIKNYNISSTNWCNITEIEEKEIELASQIPSEKIGFQVRANTVYEGWLRALKLIHTYGNLKLSDYDEKQLELINLSIVIKEEALNNPSMQGIIGITEQELEEYETSLLLADIPDGVKYTYGNRFRIQEGKDQLEYMVNTLKDKSYSRRSVAALWIPTIDMKEEEVPCLNLYQAIIQYDYLYLTSYIRANDVYNGWPRNIYGILKIQEELCQKLNCKKGYINTIAGSAHVYERNFNDLKELCENTNISYCEEDERGYFTINIESNQIQVVFYSKNGEELRKFSGTSATNLRNQCTFYISNLDHAFYLGQELMKAEIALKNNLTYIQDQEIAIKKKILSKN